MADVKISALPASAGASFVDLIAAVDMPGLVTEKQTHQQVWDLFRVNSVLLSGAITALDAGARSLVDSAGVDAIQWNVRGMNDSAGVASLDWGVRSLNDTNGNPAVDWALSQDVVVSAGIVRLGIVDALVNLPAAGTAGRIACINDALAPTYGAVAVGGGAVIATVFDDGTNWVCM